MRELSLSTSVLRRFIAYPVPLALRSDERFSGRGITLAVLDSAFVPHPDIADRIVGYFDATGEDFPLDAPVEGRHWHGSMTAVVGAGNGSLSEGVYRSLAPSANVVLVKVSGDDGIGENSVVRGLDWILENRERLDIRVLTTSIQADDRIMSAWNDDVDRKLREVVQAGITVVCAAGNDGRVSTPPGNSPWVITVGGVSLAGRRLTPYDPSCHGETVDGIMKPEMVALASQIAGPILLGSPDAVRAEALIRLAEAGPDEVQALADEFWEEAGLSSPDLDVEELYDEVWQSIHDGGIISRYYKAVDGTSFSAPIVAGLVCQMLEANGSLRPEQIKQILCQTADRIEDLDREIQGFGLVNPRRAVERALGQPHQRAETRWFTPPQRENGRVVFRHFRPMAQTVAVAGNFNDWVPQPLERDSVGLWTLELPLPDGDYVYKYVVDGEWGEDPSNLHLCEDGQGGMNSVFRLRS